MSISRKWLKEATPAQLDACFEAPNASENLKLAILGEYAIRRAELKLAQERTNSNEGKNYVATETTKPA